MKNSLLFILDLPYTIMALGPAVLSQPYEFTWHKNPYALIFKVKKFRGLIGVTPKARAAAFGHVVLLSPKEKENDLEHEIIHVEQAERYPLIYPFVYLFELRRKGYRQNRFEDEAYRLSNSVYEGGDL